MPRPARIPLSFAQRRLWLMNQLENSNPAYNMPLALRLSGVLDRDALQAALDDLVQRHESLRTIYPNEDGLPHQQILDGAQARALLIEADSSEDEIAAQLHAAARLGFDLGNTAPLRPHLFRLAADEHVLLPLTHHIVGDGASLLPLARDLSIGYAARSEGKAPGWSPLPLQYADYALWQQELLGSEDDAESMAGRQREFWRETLRDLPERLSLPVDRPHPAVPSYHGDVVPVQIPAHVHERMLQLARDGQASVFMVLQAALAGLLNRLGAGDDIVIGTPVAGRSDHALDDLIGCFVNPLVLRTDTSGQPGLRDLVARVRATNLAAYANQEFPFDRIVELAAAAAPRAPTCRCSRSCWDSSRAATGCRSACPACRSRRSRWPWTPPSSTCPSSSTNCAAPMVCRAALPAASSTAPTCSTAAPSKPSRRDWCACWSRPATRPTLRWAAWTS